MDQLDPNGKGATTTVKKQQQRRRARFAGREAGPNPRRMPLRRRKYRRRALLRRHLRHQSAAIIALLDARVTRRRADRYYGDSLTVLRRPSQHWSQQRSDR